MSTQLLMRAVVLNEFGASMTLSSMPRPVPGSGQVLVRILCSGVNPLDVKIRDGTAGQAKTRLPAILGLDMAGVVESVGPGVTRFKHGDEVFGMTGGVGDVPGTMADYAAVDADLLAIKPVNLTMREAAALPMVFLTAWEGLVDRAKISAGQTVLVTGGAGGVGHIVVQIALARGARVVATETSLRLSVLERLGATAIDFQAKTMTQVVTDHTDGQGFNLIYDTVGGVTLDAAMDAVRPYEGHVVSCAGWGLHRLAPLSFRCATYSGVFTLLPLLSGVGRSHHGEILCEARKLAESGQLKPRLDPHRFNLKDVQEAHELIDQGKAQGKVVLDVSSD